MAWNTGTNYNTRNLRSITTSISKADLKKGDILLKSGTHVVLFHSWTNNAKTKYLGYEQVGGNVSETKKWNIHPYPYWRGATGYVPRRYISITE